MNVWVIPFNSYCELHEMWSALGLTVVHSRQFHFTNFQQSFFWEDLGKGIQQLDSHQVDPKYLKIKIDFQPFTDAKPPFGTYIYWLKRCSTFHLILMKMVVDLTKIIWVLNHILKNDSLPLKLLNTWLGSNLSNPKSGIGIHYAIDLPDVVDCNFGLSTGCIQLLVCCFLPHPKWMLKTAEIANILPIQFQVLNFVFLNLF